MRKPCDRSAGPPGIVLALPVSAMGRPRILVVDAGHASAQLAAALRDLGFDAAHASEPGEALRCVAASARDVVLLRVESPEDGAAFLPMLRERGSDAAVIAVATSERLDAAVAAMRAGADSSLVAPAAPARAAVAIEKSLERRTLRRDRAALREEARRRQLIVGGTPELELVEEVVRRAAP